MATRKPKPSPSRRGTTEPGDRRPASSPVTGDRGDTADQHLSPSGRDWLLICLHMLLLLVPLATSNLTWLRVLPGIGAATALTADQFDLVKVVTMRGLVLIGVGIWGWRALRHGVPVRYTRADWLILVFLGWVVLTTVLAVHGPTAVFGKYRRFEGLLSFATYALTFFLTVQVGFTHARRRSLARTFFIASTLVALYGVLQYLGLDPALWGRLSFASNRGFSTFGNPNFLGGFLVLALPVAAALALTEQDRRWRSAYWTGFLVVTAGWLTAFTRGAWIAGILALAVLAIAVARHRQRPQATDWAFLAVTGAAVVGVMIRSLSSRDDVTNVASRLRSLFVFDQGSGYTRGLIWRAAVEAIKERPIQGAGADTFRLLFPTYKSAEYVQAVGHKDVADNAHNYVLQLAATLGIVGAALMYGLFGWVLRLSARPAFSRVGGPEALLSAGLWAGALGYIVHLLFGISVTGSTVVLWVFFALLLAPQARSRCLRAPSWGTPAALALIVLIVAASAANLTQVVADHFYVGASNAPTVEDRVEAAEQAVRWNPFNDQYRSELGYRHMAVMAEWLNRANADSQAGRDSTTSLMGARVALVDAERALTDAIAHSPLEYDNYVALALAYNWAADFDPSYVEDAESIAKRGIELSPAGPAVRVQLAEAYIQAGDLTAAEKEAQEAARLDPRYAEPLVLLGDIYRDTGRPEDAARAYEAALALDPGNSRAVRGLQSVGATGG